MDIHKITSYVFFPRTKSLIEYTKLNNLLWYVFIEFFEFLFDDNPLLFACT